ncbi:MAG: helix-turn-helix domain-containing protein [Sulfuricaulis sp.]
MTFRLDNLDSHKAAVLQDQGLSYKDIALRLGCCTSTVGYLLTKERHEKETAKYLGKDQCDGNEAKGGTERDRNRRVLR